MTPRKPSLVVSLEGTPGLMPSFPTYRTSKKKGRKGGTRAMEPELARSTRDNGPGP